MTRHQPQRAWLALLLLLSKTFCDWSHPETLRARATGRADWDPSRAGLLGNDWRYGILSAPNYSCAALAAIALFMFFIGLHVHYDGIDEVTYAEAAINYVREGTYTSAAFFTAWADETNVSPTPAFCLLIPRAQTIDYWPARRL